MFLDAYVFITVYTPKFIYKHKITFIFKRKF